MKETHLKLTLLKDMVFALNFTNAGESRLWKIVKVYPDGDCLVEHSGDKAIIKKEEIEKGEKHVEPNFSVPTGLHLKIEKVYKPHWWSKPRSVA